jgi:signal transduction histidine kinase
MPEDAREYLTIINSEAQRVARMLSTFLSVAKLEQKDRQEVAMIPLTLDDVVRDTITNLQPTAKRKRIRLVERDVQRLPPVAADRGLITQAVANLIDNAIRYSPERTSVTLSAALESRLPRIRSRSRLEGRLHAPAPVVRTATGWSVRVLQSASPTRLKGVSE